MSEKSFEMALVWFAIICGLFMSLFLSYSGDISDIKKLTGHSLHSMQQLKQECEKSLPRDKQCVIVVSAQIAKEK